jgi:hypothetical protein
MQSCTDNGDCPGGSKCTLVGPSRVCVPLCDSETDCRDDWICADGGVCLPGCADTGCDGGAVCQATTGFCVETCVPQAEACNGFDEDCDGRVDNGATCPAGGECVGGECVAPPQAAGPCTQDADCDGDACIVDSDGTVPGGFCRRPCRTNDECGEGSACFDGGNGQSTCLQTCVSARDCRQGWTCYRDIGACLPHCNFTDCADGYACDAISGTCFEPLYRIAVEQVAIAPGKPNRTPWDGLGSVAADAYDEVAGAVFGADPIAAVISALARWASTGIVPPDIRGTMEIQSYGDVVFVYTLPDGANEDSYTPGWRDAVGGGLSLLPEAATSIRLVLIDDDRPYHDAVGTVVIGDEQLREAAAAGTAFPIRTVDQGQGSIVLVVVSVLPE